MTVLRFREVDRNPAHVRVNVYAGPDEDHLALSGTLTFRVDEYPAFADAVTAHNGRQEPCGSCGAEPQTMFAHQRGCKRCPRCGGTDQPVGEYDVCQPCAIAEGWEEAA